MSDKTDFTDGQIEAAAKALFKESGYTDWDRFDEAMRELWRDRARAALTAARDYKAPPAPVKTWGRERAEEIVREGGGRNCFLLGPPGCGITVRPDYYPPHLAMDDALRSIAKHLDADLDAALAAATAKAEARIAELEKAARVAGIFYTVESHDRLLREAVEATRRQCAEAADLALAGNFGHVTGGNTRNIVEAAILAPATGGTL